MPSRNRRVSLAVLALALAGCGRTLMPTPALYYDADFEPFGNVPESRQSNVVRLLYVTDRMPEDGRGPGVAYGFGRSTSLALGTARVRIGPPDLTWDELVEASTARKRSRSLSLRYLGAEEHVRLPGWPWYVNLADEPDITQAEVETAEAEGVAAMHAVIAERMAETNDKDVYLFIHGFNNTFEYASESISELWHCGGRNGVAILYSWPAATAGIFGYAPDRESSEFTVSHLKQFLRILASCDAVERVHTIAHSRGTDVLASALRELHIHYTARGLDTAEELKLDNIVFLAADIDMEVSNQRLGGEGVMYAGRHVTIYTSAGDTALAMSADMFKSKNRIGQAGPESVTPYQRQLYFQFEDRMSVIYQPKKRGLIGHGYYLSDPGVSSDLILLLDGDRPPGAEHGRPLERDPTGIWIMPEGYPNNDSD